ncbi:MAG TPA: lipopolysaccharide biosynthesis protein [Allosphingosinicella sp.]|nr:lipopolysaccharide biosynthesis protein [Allosphingosinicella sp.]
MRRNLGWLLGGRGFQAAASLVYLGLVARALGAEGFGQFTLVLAYGEAIANLAQFQSWQTVIRYGALHRAGGNRGRLNRLLGFTATLDGASAIAGAMVACGGAALIAPLLGWSAGERQIAAIFGGVLLLSIGATPTGILRLHDRFDLVTFTQAIAPLVRLVGAGLGWAMGFGIVGFLAVWASSALLQSAVTWAAALAGPDCKPVLGWRRLMVARRENRGILRFMLVTNLSSTLNYLPDQIATLAIGGVGGAATAGGYRLASKLARSLSRPVQLLVVVIFPEFARLTAERNQAVLARVTARADRMAAILALVFAAAMGLAGPWLLQLVSGIAYPDAGTLLLLFALASAIQLSGFALEPLLTAYGRPDRVLSVRAGGALFFLMLLAVLLPLIGPIAAAWAAIGSALLVRIRLALAVRTITRSKSGRA